MALTDGLVSYWKCNDGTDALGVNDLVATNASFSSTYGKIGSGFNVTGNGYLRKGAASNMPTTEFSIGGWYHLSDLSVNSFLMCFGRDTGGAAGGLPLIFHAANGIFSAECGSGVAHVNSTTTPSLNTYYFIVYTCDGTTAKLYVNANQQGGNVSQGSGAAASSPGFCIGAYLNAATPPLANNYYHKGNGDESFIYNRAITQTEITQLYNNGAGLQYPFTIGNPGAFFQMF
jgi:hypothetical protein